MDEWDDIPQQEGMEEEAGEAPIDESKTAASGKYNKLLGEDSKKYKLSGMFREWFLDYSSYVILQRAVPHIIDGLKPVQRRVLHAMGRMDDGNYTKVANIVGQAMQFHPHGDASILGALVQLGQRDSPWTARETGETYSRATPMPHRGTSRPVSANSPRKWSSIRKSPTG